MNVRGTTLSPADAMRRAVEIARANAASAIDQWDEYEDAVSAYATNVRDSLDEEGLRVHTAYALKAYYARIAELL